MATRNRRIILSRTRLPYLIITDGAGHYAQLPSLTSTQRDALTAVNGMIIYNSTLGTYQSYEASAWGNVAAQQLPKEHGATQHTDVARELFIPAHAGWMSGTTATYDAHQAVLCGNAVTAGIRISFKVPDDFVSYTKLELIWICAAASGNGVFQGQADWAASGETYNTHTETMAQLTYATGGASKLNVQQFSVPVVFANLAVGDYVGLQWVRAAGHASDTLEDDVYMIGVLFTYVASQ